MYYKTILSPIKPITEIRIRYIMENYGYSDIGAGSGIVMPLPSVPNV